MGSGKSGNGEREEWEWGAGRGGMGRGKRGNGGWEGGWGAGRMGMGSGKSGNGEGERAGTSVWSCVLGSPSLGELGTRGPCDDRKSTRLNSSHGYTSYAV